MNINSNLTTLNLDADNSSAEDCPERAYGDIDESGYHAKTSPQKDLEEKQLLENQEVKQMVDDQKCLS